MNSNVADNAAEHATFARHTATAVWPPLCWTLLIERDTRPASSQCIEGIGGDHWPWTEVPVISIRLPDLMGQLEELRVHERVFGTMINALEAASIGPHAEAVRAQHAEVLRGRARTRSAIGQLVADVRAACARRLLAACARRDTARPRRHLVATRSSRHSRRARRAAHVGRATAKATGDPPDPEPPGRAAHRPLEGAASTRGLW